MLQYNLWQSSDQHHVATVEQTDNNFMEYPNKI